MRLFRRSLIEGALTQVRSTPVAHYTRIGALCHFIPENSSGWGSAWATPVQFLNDRQELSMGLGILQRIASQTPQSGQGVRTAIYELLTTLGELETDAFQMSFSGNADEIGQWRGYAANGIGCSLVTDALEVKSVADVAGWVLYDLAKQEALARKVLNGLRPEKDATLIKQALVAAASYMKHKGFRPEKEFRLLKFPAASDVCFRESGDRLVPYVDYLKGQAPLPISRILIGPTWQLSDLPTSEFLRNHVVLGIQRLLTARGLYSTSIEPSRIPYDPR